jgi:hypothetical protein
MRIRIADSGSRLIPGKRFWPARWFLPFHWPARADLFLKGRCVVPGKKKRHTFADINRKHYGKATGERDADSQIDRPDKEAEASAELPRSDRPLSELRWLVASLDDPDLQQPDQKAYIEGELEVWGDCVNMLCVWLENQGLLKNEGKLTVDGVDAFAMLSARRGLA